MMPSPSSHDHVLRRSFSEQRSFPRSCNHSYRFYINLLITLFCVFLTLLQIQTVIRTSTAPFTFPSSYSAWPLLAHHVHNLIGELELRQRSTAEPRGNVTFLPLKDLRFAETAMVGNTWFMSSVNDTKEKGEAEYVYFPSKEMDGKLLCLGGGSASNGTMNSYALAPAEALPPNAKLLSGPTFVSDTFYSYDNIFHGISALAPFVAWHERKACVMPARWVLYQQGEIRRNLKSPWIRTLMEATFGPSMEIEQFRKSDEGPSCFEQAVVFRHNQGAMGRERKEKLYDLLRCNARAYCNITMEEDGLKAIRLTLLLRVGARSFKDDDAVIHIFRRECTKVEGCRLKIAHPNNLNFCDQVKLMSGTDILASPHGAQLTNMFFMDKNSSVMEFFPKGWLELAGVGQYVYRWLADWSGMRHQGAWNDPHGEPCPPGLTTSCFSFLKNQQLGHDEAFFSNWTARVLGETRRYKLQKPSTEAAQEREGHCKCG